MDMSSSVSWKKKKKKKNNNNDSSADNFAQSAKR